VNLSKAVLPSPILNKVNKFFILSTASGLGLGLIPMAPGTFGSLLGLPLGLWFLKFPIYYGFAICFLLLLVLIPIAHRAAKHWGHMDCQKIVCDEVLGQTITLLGLRGLWTQFDRAEALGFVVFSFAVFRILDITKPFPAKLFDRKPSGFGIMADDVVAGLYGAIIVWGTARIWLS
jgi:phosphatidylglycerophosphatase A